MEAFVSFSFALPVS